MKRIKLGEYNRLTIVKAVDFGLYLDNEERIVATTQKPLAKVGDFAYLEVSWVNEYGAFLHWGPLKDLFCPFREQKMRMEIGESYIVFVYIDRESYRIAASAKIEHYLQKDTPPYTVGTETDLLIWQKTDLGFKVIIDNRYQGLVYEDQIFKRIHTGDRMKGYISRVREDGKLDVTLQPLGYQQARAFSDTLLQYLKNNGGFCDLGDKSDAEDIKRRFQVSKKTFKKAVGDLYKRCLIVLDEQGIRLV